MTGERIHSAITRAWTGEEQRTYLASLSTREAFHVAITPAPILSSVAHVGQLGTFLLPDWRGRGKRLALFDVTRRFAASTGYRKLVIQVRASNVAAQAFYKRLGFVECGRLHAQVVVDGTEDDEIVMELLFSE